MSVLISARTFTFLLMKYFLNKYSLTGSFFNGPSSRNNEEVSLIRKADLENHNKDGGFWTVIEGKVYDIKDFQAQSLTGNSILGKSGRILRTDIRYYRFPTSLR